MNKGLFKGSSDTQPNKGLSSGDVSLSLIPQKSSDYISMDAPIRGSRNTLIGEVKFNSFAAYYPFPKLSDPASLPAGIGYGAAFDTNSKKLAVAHATSPFVTIYDIRRSTNLDSYPIDLDTSIKISVKT